MGVTLHHISVVVGLSPIVRPIIFRSVLDTWVTVYTEDIGNTNDQIDRVHTGLREYDIKVDTTNHSAFEVAKQILDYVDNTSEPQGFIKMCEMLN